MTVRARGLRRGLRAAAFAGAASLAGCGGVVGGPPPPADGTLTLTITPGSASVSQLTLASASVHLEGISVIGDVAPDGRSMISDLQIDALSTAGTSVKLATIPQGVYSHVRFKVEHTSAQGTWRGMPLSVSLESDDGTPVDLSSSAAVDVAPGHDGTFSVTLDVASWFAGALLDGATPVSGQITVDNGNNSAIGSQLKSRVAASFALKTSPLP
jgi:hypothetical protein